MGDPHNNKRRKEVVWLKKHQIRESMDTKGKPDNDKSSRAMLQYGDTPQKAINMPMMENLFGGQI